MEQLGKRRRKKKKKKRHKNGYSPRAFFMVVKVSSPHPFGAPNGTGRKEEKKKKRKKKKK